MTRRSDDGLAYHSWFDSGLSLVERVIVLKSDSPDDEIDTNMSLHFIKCIATLENLNDKPICVILNSTGGDMIGLRILIVLFVFEVMVLLCLVRLL